MGVCGTVRYPSAPPSGTDNTNQALSVLFLCENVNIYQSNSSMIWFGSNSDYPIFHNFLDKSYEL